jgi:hypothetical protein
VKVMIGRISLIELIRISGGFNSNVGIVCSTNIEISFHGSSFLREAKSLSLGTLTLSKDELQTIDPLV